MSRINNISGRIGCRGKGEGLGRGINRGGAVIKEKEGRKGWEYKACFGFNSWKMDNGERSEKLQKLSAVSQILVGDD